MKRLLTGALALSLLTGTAAMAQPYNHDDHGRYDQNRHDDRHDNRDFGRNGGHGHHWARGQRLPNTWYQARSHYVDYRSYHLRALPCGFCWVCSVVFFFALVA